MAEKLYGQFKDFSAGLNAKDGASLALEQELIEVENAILGRGFVQKRCGYEPFSVAPTQSTLFLWNQFGSKNWSDV
jgi:hypothetical protein